MIKAMLYMGVAFFKGEIMENKELTQEQYIIEKLGIENARLKIAIEQMNFALLVKEKEIETLKNKKQQGE